MHIARKPEETKRKIKKIVPDTSALISGRLSKMLEEDKLKDVEIIIPQIVMGELQAQTSRGKEIGFIGLEEIKNIKSLAEKKKIKLTFVGERPSYENIMLAKSGRLDAMIQDVAKTNKATLLTLDLPQALVAEAEGIHVKYFEPYEKGKKIKLDDFFTPDTMSVHLKQDCLPLAKRGKPGDFKLVKISKKPLTEQDLESIAKEIFDATKYEEKSSIEISQYGAHVVQLKNTRIAIARPPFSDKTEITAVRPITKLCLEDYKLSEKLKKRLAEKAEGILLAGPPGSGKSTFAASLAEFYLAQNKIIKTMENPRDLQVPNEVTQYAPLENSFAKTSDILLLVRPDYTIFDEIRKTKDFEVFADMRMAGIGMIGVVHSSEPVDAIQRFLGRIEMGIIPHVIDTIIFIKAGKIEKVYSLSLTVRTPNGMTEQDLARPIVEVNDFESGKLEYEIYTYGEQTIVVPVREPREPALQKLASRAILEEIRRFDKDAKIEWLSPEKVSVKVRNEIVPILIGKEGKTIKSVEEKLGISIDVEPLVESMGKKAEFETTESGAYIIFDFKGLSGKNANIYIEGEYLFSATIGRKGHIKITKDSDLGKELLRALTKKKQIEVYI